METLLSTLLEGGRSVGRSRRNKNGTSCFSRRSSFLSLLSSNIERILRRNAARIITSKVRELGYRRGGGGNNWLISSEAYFDCIVYLYLVGSIKSIISTNTVSILSSLEPDSLISRDINWTRFFSVYHRSFKIFPIVTKRERVVFFLLRFGTIRSSVIRAGMYRREIIQYFDSFEFFPVFHGVVSRLTVPLLNSTLSTKTIASCTR